jgi:8-oxo-dGTP pyrophosphatase MutT (NUDIX family)
VGGVTGEGPEPSFDPETVPVLPAATVMLLADLPDLHVQILTRRKGSSFVPGMVVFPGGGLDDEDADPAWERLVDGIDDAGASAQLGIDRGGLAYWVAAVRETWEESGVLLARGVETGPDRLAALRVAVDRGERGFLDVVRHEGWRLAGDELAGIARWITPVGLTRRYDTQFLVAELPAGQEAAHDGVEAVASAWMRPADAVAAWETGGLRMLPPTLRMLKTLATWDRTADVLSAARACPPPGGQEALVASDGRDVDVLLPGDAGYEAHLDGLTLGWVHLPTGPLR